MPKSFQVCFGGWAYPYASTPWKEVETKLFALNVVSNVLGFWTSIFYCRYFHSILFHSFQFLGPSLDYIYVVYAVFFFSFQFISLHKKEFSCFYILIVSSFDYINYVNNLRITAMLNWQRSNAIRAFWWVLGLTVCYQVYL